MPDTPTPKEQAEAEKKLKQQQRLKLEEEMKEMAEKLKELDVNGTSDSKSALPLTTLASPAPS